MARSYSSVPGRIEVLDAMRGIAALLVLGYHYTTRYTELFGTKPLPFEVKFGGLGVNLFFVISGFVIFWSLNSAHKIADFVVARISRLYPAFWISVVLTATVLIFADLPGRNVGLGQFLINLTMLQEFFHVPAVDGVYWTLTVELRFYFWMVVLWLLGAGRRPLMAISVWLFLAYLQPALPSFMARIFLLEYFHLFAFGIAVSVLYHSNWKSLAGWLVAGLALGCGGYVDALIKMLFLVLVWFQPGLLRARLFLWLGAISYPLYLVHQNIGYAIIRVGGANYLAVIVALLISILIAKLIHDRIEIPAMRGIKTMYRTYFLRR